MYCHHVSHGGFLLHISDSLVQLYSKNLQTKPQLKDLKTLADISISDFVERSLGTWHSKRSGHNLAFRHVEEVESTIEIIAEPHDSAELIQLLESNEVESQAITNPFRMSWRGSSDWDESEVSAGECLLVPVPDDARSGRLLRSIGYTEEIPAVGHYRLGDDGAFTLFTPYQGSSAEERIWFATKDVRLRVSMMRTQGGQGIVQASFSSEIRQQNRS